MLDFAVRKIVDRALHQQVEQSLAGEARFLASELNATSPEGASEATRCGFLRDAIPGRGLSLGRLVLRELRLGSALPVRGASRHGRPQAKRWSDRA